MRLLSLLVVAVVVGVGGIAGVASAQPVPPFYSAQPTGFDPVIDVISSGALLDAQVWVSEDRKYVNMNLQASNPRLLALQQYTVTRQTNLGYVGGVQFAPAATPRGAAPRAKAPAPPRRSGASILTQQGMTRISPR